MTLRLCIIGNSHVAALRDAWMQQPDRWPALSLDFWAAQRDHLRRTIVQHGRLMPTDTAGRAEMQQINGRSDVDLAEFDGFVIAGAAICVQAILPIYRDARWTGLPSVRRGTPALISAGAARAVMGAILQDRLGYALAHRLRPQCVQPILMTSQPRVSAQILQSPRPELRLHSVAIRNADADALGAGFDGVATDLFTGLGCRFLPQPPQTVAQGVLTQVQYVRGARRLSADMGALQPQSDLMHANAQYGALVLDQIAAAF